MVQPKGILTIPEAFYFRLIVHFLRRFSAMGEPQLSRNQCTFFLGDQLKMELLYHSRGQCIMVTVSGKFNGLAKVHVSSARKFLKESMEKAKQVGMKGYKTSCQLGKCQTIKRSDTLEVLRLDSDSLVCLDGYHPGKDPDLLNSQANFLEEADLVMYPDVVIRLRTRVLHV
eukprot:m.205067 g.205067  ORF g.205067 m.205067 type:complete len:171 (+) comp39656_c0_seq2:694-1206(+)